MEFFYPIFMKKLYPLSLVAIFALFYCLITTPKLNAQEVLYYENFSQGIPDTYIINDVDDLPIDPSLDSITSFTYDGGWVIDINFEDPTDTVAASSSWYTPAGISNDWLITPQISIPESGTYYLQWRSWTLDSNFPDGYEVYISTSGTSIADFTNLIFSLPEEKSFWVTHKVSLEGFSGEDIHIGFRNNSDDKLILFLDDIYIADSLATVTGDPAVVFSEFPDIYTIAPLGQLDTFLLSAIIRNQGNQALEDTLEIAATIINAGTGNRLFEENLAGPFEQSLEGPTPTASIDTFGLGLFVGIPPTFVPVDTGLYVITYVVNSAEQNVLPENEFTDEAFGNDFSFKVVEVSDTILARDDGSLSTRNPFWELPSSIFGENHRSIFGSGFFLNKSDVLTSITAFFGSTGENVGDILTAQVYNDSLELIAQGDTYTITADDTTGITAATFSFAQGSVNKQADIAGVELSPGLYWMAIEGPEFLPMGTSDNIYLEQGTLFTSDSLADAGRWFSTEGLKPILDSFIVQQGGNVLFNERRVFTIRANMAGCSSLDGQLNIVDDDGSGNGSVAVIPSGGQLPYSYAWTDPNPRPETDSLITGLDQGRYDVMISDARGCEFQLSATILTVGTLDPIDLGFSKFQAYPNPAINSLTVDMTLDNPDQIRLTLLDIQGRELNSQSFENRLSVETQIPTDNIPSGIYLLQVRTSRGMIHKRIMVR